MNSEMRSGFDKNKMGDRTYEYVMPLEVLLKLAYG
jgi:hypothetical protein